ncbi:MAG: hypothetical protein AB7U73_23725, partial [Pirellulales bacterium]
EKIPITILSRCQRFDFAGIETDAIAARLAQIAAAEGVQAEPEALELLARKAAGSMRDSQSLLEQLLAFGGKTLTAADVHSLLGTAAGGRLTALATKLAQGDAAGVLTEFDAALADGVDPGQLLNQLLGFLRDALVAAVGGPSERFLYSGPAEQATVRQVSEQLGIESLLAAMQMLDQTLGRMRYSSQGRTLAELALVRIARMENLSALADLLEQARHGDLPALDAAAAPDQSSGGAKKKSAEVGPPAIRDTTDDLQGAEPPRDESPARQPASLDPGGTPRIEAGSNGLDLGPVDSAWPSGKPPAATSPSAPSSQITELAVEAELQSAPSKAGDCTVSPDELWKQVLARLPDTTADFAKHAADIAISAPKRLVATFPSQYSYSQSMCERPDRLGRIAEVLEEVAGPGWRLELLVADEPPGQMVAPTAGPVRRQDRIRAAAERPIVRRAMELFNASPTRIEDAPAMATEARPAED